MRHALLQHGHAGVSELAVLHKVRVGHHVLWEQFALLDLEGLLRSGELLLKLELNVQKVDALGTKVFGQGGSGDDVVPIRTQRVLQDVGHLLFNLCAGNSHRVSVWWHPCTRARHGRRTIPGHPWDGVCGGIRKGRSVNRPETAVSGSTATVSSTRCRRTMPTPLNKNEPSGSSFSS